MEKNVEGIFEGKINMAETNKRMIKLLLGDNNEYIQDNENDYNVVLNLNTCMMIWLQNIKKDITFWVLGRFFINLRIYDKLLLLILPFHLNIITKGLKKIFLINKKDIIKLQTKMNIFEFTRKNNFFCNSIF